MADKRELILDLLARDKTGQGTGSAARNLDKVGKAADQAGDQAQQFGKATVLASRGADELGDASSRAQRKVDSLSDEIRKVEQDLALLAGQFADTSDAAQRLDISKAIRRSENDLRRLSKSRGILSALIPDTIPPAVTQGLVRSLGTSIASSARGAPGLGLAGAGLAAGLAPSLGAGVSAAVIGGVGLGGIIGGAALVAKDPQVMGHAKAIGKTFTAGIKSEARQSFLGPVTDSLRDVEALAARSVPKIGKIFDATAPSLKGFTGNVARAGDALLDSFVVTAGKSRPVMDALGRLVANTGVQVGKFIETVGDNSDAAASAVDDFNTAMEHTITVAGAVVDALGQIKRATDSVDGVIDSFRSWVEDNSPFDLTADGYAKGSEAAELYRQGVIGAAGAVNDYAAYQKTATGQTTAAATAHDAAARALRGEREALTELGNGIKAQTDPLFGLIDASFTLRQRQDAAAEAARKFGTRSDEARKANIELAKAAFDLNTKVGALGSTFDGKLTPSMRGTLQAAGLTKQQIDAIEREFRNAKKAGDAYAKTYAAKVVINTQIYRRISTIVTSAAQKAYEEEKRRIAQRASGGPVTRGTPYVVGEHGPEVVIPDANGRVLSAAASRGLTRQGTRGNPVPVGGGAAAPATLGAPVSRRTRVELELVGAAEFRTAFKYMIRTMNLIEE